MPDLASPLIAWYRENARDLPWRRPGFGAWGVLVSEFMLQQTPVNRVVPHLDDWLRRWPTPASLAAEPPAEAVRQWANLGYPRRALWLHRAAVEIRDRHGGEVPRDRAALETLPGVGRKTANVVASIAFGEPTIAVDTHVFRVANRTGLAPGKTVLEVEKRLMKRVPAKYLRHAHHWLILHGRYTCLARKPLCPRCPVADLCRFKAKTKAA